MAEAEYLNGSPITWGKPPLPTDIVRWSKRDWKGRIVKGSLRTICHLNRMNWLSLGKFGTQIEIIQGPFSTGVVASAGTHDLDCVWDAYIPGVGWWDQQRFFRENGSGSWYRHPPLFGNHIHGFTLPPKEGRVISDDFAVAGYRVGKHVPGQLVDYYAHAFGLYEQHAPGSDRSWFPPKIEDTIFDLDAYVSWRATREASRRKAENRLDAARKKARAEAEETAEALAGGICLPEQKGTP